MGTLEIFLNVLGLTIMGYGLSLLGNYLYPRFKAKELKDEAKAQKEKVVKMNKLTLIMFICLVMLCNLIGIIIFAFPNFITGYLEFNYITTITIWWIPMTFNDVILSFVLIEVRYNNEEIIVKKPLRKAKKYRIDEIVSFTKKRNLIIKTTHGKIVLFRALSGTESLREFLFKKFYF